MNIFATCVNPKWCAMALDDRRLVKMVLETAQMLSTALRLTLRERGDVEPEQLYKATHVNHPCSVWARKTRANYSWLLVHFDMLAAEYTHRFKKTHKSHDKLRGTLAIGIVLMPEGDRTTFPNCTDFTTSETGEAYRLHLTKKWLGDIAAGRPPKWTGRAQPDFYVDQGILARAQLMLMQEKHDVQT